MYSANTPISLPLIHLPYCSHLYAPLWCSRYLQKRLCQSELGATLYKPFIKTSTVFQQAVSCGPLSTTWWKQCWDSVCKRKSRNCFSIIMVSNDRLPCKTQCQAWWKVLKIWHQHTMNITHNTGCWHTMMNAWWGEHHKNLSGRRITTLLTTTTTTACSTGDANVINRRLIIV